MLWMSYLLLPLMTSLSFSSLLFYVLSIMFFSFVFLDNVFYVFMLSVLFVYPLLNAINQTAVSIYWI